ncbi:MAG: hypothetical protein OXU62_02655 [Gammaproteobacteria bacterium]|nr:hypothetical protein [Gammaproteobacteria bacterium]
MPGDLNVQLRLTADGKGFVGEVRVAKRELDRFTGSTGKSSRAARLTPPRGVLHFPRCLPEGAGPD